VRFQARPFAEGGDIITRIEDRPIRDSDDLSEAVQRFDPGQTVTLEIWRDGEKRDVELELGERPLSNPREPAG
jgi:S1-C subfamily serine protease